MCFFEGVGARLICGQPSTTAGPLLNSPHTPGCTHTHTCSGFRELTTYTGRGCFTGTRGRPRKAALLLDDKLEKQGRERVYLFLFFLPLRVPSAHSEGVCIAQLSSRLCTIPDWDVNFMPLSCITHIPKRGLLFLHPMSSQDCSRAEIYYRGICPIKYFLF